jgi:hypothetical protein
LYSHVMYIHHMAMVRKQLYLSAEQNDRLQRTSAHARRSEAEVVREALDRYFAAAVRRRAPTGADPLWKIVGIAASSDGDLSARVDEMLYRKPR